MGGTRGVKTMSAREEFEKMNKLTPTAGGDEMPEQAEVQAESEVVLDADQDNLGGETAEEGAPVAEVGEGAPVAEGEAVAAEGGEMMTEGEAVAADGEMSSDGAVSEDEAQQEASWRGRLDAREREIAAREAAIAEREAVSEPVAGEMAEEGGEAGAEQYDLNTPEGRLSANFGPDFVADVSAVIANSIEAATAKVGKSFSGFRSELSWLDAAMRSAIGKLADVMRTQHEKAIATAHPDYEEIMSGPYWAEFKGSLPDEQRAQVEAVEEGGTWAEAIQVLGDYKQWLGARAKSEESGQQEPLADLDEVAGVRGGAPVRTSMAQPKDARAIFNELNGLPNA
jgi:hypothetical protein